MAYKFTYFTLQHSGTRFLEKYFIHLGFSPLRLTERCRECGGMHGYEKHMDERNRSGRIEYSWRHYTSNPKNTITAPDIGGPNTTNYPVVSTLRHPHKTAISYLSRGFDLRECVRGWDSFIDASNVKKLTYFNVDCNVENRKPQLLNLVKDIDCYDENTEELTSTFVKDWAPVGSWTSDIKKEFDRSGKLPDVFNWSRFDRAVNWYNKIIKEIKFQ